MIISIFITNLYSFSWVFNDTCIFSFDILHWWLPLLLITYDVTFAEILTLEIICIPLKTVKSEFWTTFRLKAIDIRLSCFTHTWGKFKSTVQTHCWDSSLLFSALIRAVQFTPQPINPLNMGSKCGTSPYAVFLNRRWRYPGRRRTNTTDTKLRCSCTYTCNILESVLKFLQQNSPSDKKD